MDSSGEGQEGDPATIHLTSVVKGGDDVTAEIVRNEIGKFSALFPMEVSTPHTHTGPLVSQVSRDGP